MSKFDSTSQELRTCHKCSISHYSFCKVLVCQTELKSFKSILIHSLPEVSSGVQRQDRCKPENSLISFLDYCPVNCSICHLKGNSHPNYQINNINVYYTRKKLLYFKITSHCNKIWQQPPTVISYGKIFLMLLHNLHIGA